MDTLNQYKQRPLLAAMDLTQSRLQYVMGGYPRAKKMLLDYEGNIKASPEQEALWFYVQNHVMHLVKRAVDGEEPLLKYQEFVDTYHIDINRKMIRMFYYLLLICSRESRHMLSGAGRNKLWKKYPNIYGYHSNHVQDSSSEAAVNALIKNAPDITLGEYTQFLVDAFQFPRYSKGFGGKSWKRVAEPLRDFVHGKITAEVLMDTGFTLAHNNGPIFNKGMLYTSFNGLHLNKILDIQRSGQIPQFIIGSEGKENIAASMVEYVRHVSTLCPEVLGTVNWNIVTKSSFGSNVYAAEIQSMKKSTPDKLAAEAAEFLSKKNSVEISNGVFVAKSERSL